MSIEIWMISLFRPKKKQLRPVTASGVEPFGDSNGRSKSCECALSTSNHGLV